MLVMEHYQELSGVLWYPGFQLVENSNLVMEVDNCNYKVFEFHFIILSTVKEKEAEISEEQHT